MVAINTAEMLRRAGHEVRVFAMDYPENRPLEGVALDLAPEIDFGASGAGKLKAASRCFGAGVGQSFSRVLREFKPDVVHLHNIHSYLSPRVGELAAKAGARVVWTMHDYKLICPSYSMLRNGRICEDCLSDKGAVLSRRCMKGSLAASVIARAEQIYWSRQRLESFTSAFICPSRFMADMMARGGFDPGKLVTLCNTAGAEKMHLLSSLSSAPRQDYWCYVGRLSPEKGVDTLLRAASRFGMELRVAGDGPLSAELRERYAGVPHIKFLGRIDPDAVARLLAGARFSAIPSEWYENNPLGVIESLVAGTPVLGAEIGGIPELIGEGDGLTYPSGDAESLLNALERMAASEWDHAAIAARAAVRFSPDAHLKSLIEIYSGSKP